MTKKPSLYVVERKEVVILVVLFVLVTILSFTMGVKYGESSGKKQALDEKAAVEEVAEAKTETGGHLGDASHTDTSAPPQNDPNAAATTAKSEPHSDPSAPSEAGSKADAHGSTAAPGALATPSPVPSPAPQTSPASSASKDSVAESADAYLLNALKEAGIDSARKGASKPSPNSAAEPTNSPSESEEAEEALPDDVKAKPKAVAEDESDSWVIQVASYNTEQEAKKHADRLRSRSLEPLIFSGMDSQNGKWYRVALGKYADREKAGQIARNYKTKGWIGSGSFVRRAP